MLAENYKLVTPHYLEDNEKGGPHCSSIKKKKRERVVLVIKIKAKILHKNNSLNKNRNIMKIVLLEKQSYTCLFKKKTLLISVRLISI